MRILFITTGHSLDDVRVTRKEAVTLARLGHKVSVCGQYRKKYDNKDVRLIDIATLDDVSDDTPVCPAVKSRLQRVRMIGKLIRIARIMRPDLIVAHEFESAVAALVIRLRYSIPYVFDVHEGYECSVPQILPRFLRPCGRVIMRMILRVVVKFSRGITACSPGVYPYVLACRIGKRNMLIYNSPSVALFPFSDEERPVPTLVHEGNVSIDRGIFQLLDACGRVAKKRNFVLKFFGRVEEGIVSAIKHRIIHLGIDKKIEMTGQLDYERLGEEESKCQIGIIIGDDSYNYRLALPNKLFSYMSCGMAVLGPRFGEMERLLQKENCGVTANPLSSEDIADKLEWLIDHPKECRVMANNGRMAMENQYSWEKMEESMGVFYGGIGKEIRTAACDDCT